MPFCSECGTSLTGKFCANCGAPSSVDRGEITRSKTAEMAVVSAPPAMRDQGSLGTPERPDTVGLAVKLLYIAFAIGALTSFLTFPALKERQQIPEGSEAPVVIGIIAGYAIVWFLIDRVSAGRNWARILLLVLLVIGIPFSLASFKQQMENDPLDELISLLSLGTLGLNVIAVVFLFQQKSSEWYRQIGMRN